MWRICYEFFDEHGESVGTGNRRQTYKYKGNAERMARKYYGPDGENRVFGPDSKIRVYIKDQWAFSMRWWVEKVSDSA